MGRKIGMTLVLMTALWVVGTMPTLADGETERYLAAAKLKADCEMVSIWVRGNLPAGVTELIEVRITFTDLNGEVLELNESFPVTGDTEGKFKKIGVREWDEPLCGRFQIEGRARLNGLRPIDIEVVSDNPIDCCTGTIGDFVWNDLNGNGVQEAGEPGIEGVRLVLTRTNGSTWETVTDADGFYLFENLCPTDYEVDLDESTLPTGFVATLPNVGDPEFDSDQPLDGSPVPVTLCGPFASDCENLTIDFGFVEEPRCTGTIGDFVWEDLNFDGIQDVGEPGKEGFEVCLFDGVGDLIECTQTDVDGYYLFEDLCAGDYVVEVEERAGFGPTLVNVGSDDSIDSDPNPMMVNLPFDDFEDLTIDFGCAECLPCKGGVLALSMRYLGDTEALVEVDDGDTLFLEVVQPGQVFSFDNLGEKMGDLDIYVDGVLNTEIHTSCSQPLGPGLIFGDFEVVAGVSKDHGPMCPLVPCAIETVDFELSGDKAKWRVKNVGDGIITIGTLSVTWPEANGNLIEVKFSGDRINDDSFPPPSVVIDTWLGNIDKRQIEPDKDEVLELKFENDVVEDPSMYEVMIDFAEGCSLTFVPGDVPFICEKPITAISMIWDGTEPVDIIAYNGDTGEDVITTINDITMGDEVTVSGYSTPPFDGTPNDVYWEVFAAAGTKLGESVFHLSCSDSEMNGEEDCGNREGNGKSDDSQLINDWLFEGMVGQSGALDCTP